MERFANLLHELGTLMEVDLYPDPKGACRLVIDDQLRVQLECNVRPDHLLIASFLTDIAPGKFRENVLKDALKANFPQPLDGQLAYSERNNQLTLFVFLPLAGLTGQKLFDFLGLFIQKANAWKQAVASGNTVTLVPSSSFRMPGALFGLKP